MPFNIKLRLMQLGKKQKDLIPELAKLKINASPADISNALNGSYQSPKLDRIVSACNEIVSKWEKESDKNIESRRARKETSYEKKIKM